MVKEGRVLRYFPIWVIAKVVVIVRKGNRDESKLKSLSEPTRGSRDSGECFVVVGRGEIKISFDVMGHASSDHSATSFCLGRVIIASGGYVFHLGEILILFL